MKKQLRLTTRTAIVALAAGALCLAGNASAQKSESSPDSSSSASPSASAESSSSKSSEKSSSSSNSSSSSTKKSGMNDAGRSAGAATGASVNRQDRDFMMTAAKGGMMEVHMGQMAEKMGQSSEVKKLGSRMVADHTKANNQLMALATARGVKLDTRHNMSKMDQANFDQMWLNQMVKDHEKTIAAFQTEAKGGADPELKSFASKTLPTLQKHLELVKAAQGKVGGGMNGNAAKTKQS